MNKNEIYKFVLEKKHTTVMQIYQQVGGTPEMVWDLLFVLYTDDKVIMIEGRVSKMLPKDWQHCSVWIK